MPRNLSEADRKKNQFDKEERVHLLAIMKQYAPLLDKSASTLARKKIWTTIEDEFKKAGFTRKTSAQLKKYWQNYKYHCKKAMAFGKENKKCIESETTECLEWNRYQVFVENRSPTKFSQIPDVVRSLADHLQRSPTKSGGRFRDKYEDNAANAHHSNNPDAFIDLSRVKVERNDDQASDDSKAEGTNTLENVSLKEDINLEERKEILANEDRLVVSTSSSLSSSSSSSSSSLLSNNATECKTMNRIVVSNARISNNSVTVSVIYPENDNSYFSTNAIDGTVQASLPSRRTADAVWNEQQAQQGDWLNSRKTRATNDGARAMPFGYHHNLAECKNDRTRSKETNANSEVYGSLECNANDDSSRDKKMEKSSKEDGDVIATESDENEVGGVRARNSTARRDQSFGKGYVFLTDYRSRLKHRLLLQQLEAEEKRLKIKIAEMAIQEVQLRIKALSEDMRRTEELHRLRLARTAAGNRQTFE
ncbi:uncharacterized protein LOC132916789 isoform X2 [Bombus pascuorum]|uniref:uncharacterized protein LOC132916789 isoform X2 n=1 Tax=Bombus pascuorum TaxID=65598 RepID=UPI002143519A|nr:uncharacterized protein LOC132916789 isoform X2 [Bombus pascuorum]